MASPSVALTTLARELGTYFEARLEELRADYIADMVFPVMDVLLPSASFKKVPIEELLTVEPELKRSPSTGYWRSTFQFEQDSYMTYDRGAEEPIDDDEEAMYADFISLSQAATNRLAHIILQEKEKRIAATVMDTGVFTGALSQAVTNSAWDVANSTPVDDIRIAGDKMFTNIGLYPSTLIINRKTFRVLRNHPQVVAQIESTGAGDQARTRDVTTAQLAAVFDVDRVLVGGGAKNTNAVFGGLTIASVWPNHAMLCQTATTNDIQEPCIGRQFHWARSGSRPGGSISVYREEGIRSDVVRNRMYSGEKLIHPQLGMLIPSVIS